MKVLAIGGTRFIGLHAVKRLAGLGHEVTVFHRGETEPASLTGVSHIHGDRTDLRAHRAEFTALAPDVVIDMVPRNESDAAAVVDTVSGLTPRLVALSSQDVYAAYGVLIGQQEGPMNHDPLREDAPLRDRLYPYRDRFPAEHPLHLYDKIPVERAYMTEASWEATILRLPCVYGPDDYQHRMWPYLRRMLDGRRAILLSQQMAKWRWTRGYVENIVDAIVLATTRSEAAGRIYNVGEPSALSEREWVETIGRAAGWPGDVVVVDGDDLPDHLRSEANYSQPLVADTDLIRDELGYEESVTMAEAIPRTVAWECANNPKQSLGNDSFDYAAEDRALEAAAAGN